MGRFKDRQKLIVNQQLLSNTCERGETHFLRGNYCSFSCAISRAAHGGSRHARLNGFGGNSSLVFLGHSQTCSLFLIKVVALS